MRTAAAILLFTALLSLPGDCAEVLQVRWPTRLAAPPPVLPKQQADWLPAFRLAVGNLPEEAVVTGSLLQGQMLGLAVADAANLHKLFTEYYGRLRQSPEFKAAPSPLPYCYSERKPGEGLATVFVPAKVDGETEVIVFLHGFGGSLLVYPHYLAEVFPERLIICPAYGISPAETPAAYLAEAMQAVAERLQMKLQKPLLVGLSAGGVGACRIYAQKPNHFSALICLGAFPPNDAVARSSKDMGLRFICGGTEPFIVNGAFQKQMTALQSKVGSLEWKTIEGADHYFLLSHERQTRALLREWASQ